jgi:Protein of unknown function (DUF2971)
MRVYHFLSAQNALSDIALRRIRISRYGDLNDPFELLAVNMGNDRALRRAMKEFKDEFNRKIGLLCFSRNWKSPVLWSHYASKHRGICLGFDLKDELAIDVEYADDRLPVSFQNGNPSKGLDEEFVSRLISTKSAHWKYEDEVRVQVKLDEGTIEDGSYFYPLDDELALREVVLGPLCGMSVDAVQALVDSLYPSIPVRKARLAFKFFQVVPDERYERKNG